MSNLRNLTTLYAQLPITDIFLAEALQNTIESHGDDSCTDRPLHCLRDVYPSSACNYHHEVGRQEFNLGLNHTWLIFRLPNIQKLSFYDMNSLEAFNRFAKDSKTSSITDLTIVYPVNEIPVVSDMLALLALPIRLTILSIYFNDSHSDQSSARFSNSDL